MANRGPRIQRCHKEKKHPAEAHRAYAPFMLLEKPFDGKKPSLFLRLPQLLIRLFGLLGHPVLEAI